MEDSPKNLRERRRWEYIGIPLGIFVLVKIAWPLRNIALVYWVRGGVAYSAGIRVLPGKPTRFSDGQYVPDLPDFITGMVAFFVAMSVGMLVVRVVFRVYDRYHSRNAAS